MSNHIDDFFATHQDSVASVPPRAKRSDAGIPRPHYDNTGRQAAAELRAILHGEFELPSERRKRLAAERAAKLAQSKSAERARKVAGACCEACSSKPTSPTGLVVSSAKRRVFNKDGEELKVVTAGAVLCRRCSARSLLVLDETDETDETR